MCVAVQFIGTTNNKIKITQFLLSCVGVQLIRATK